MTFLSTLILSSMIATSGMATITDDSDQYERLTVSDGLANMITRATTQTSNGLIWFATHDGIQSYDGTIFKTYPVSAMTGRHGDDNRFINIMSKGDTLWCSTFTDVFTYNPVKDVFHCIFSPDMVNHYISINALDVVSDRYLFISTSTGIYVFGTDGKFFKKFDTKNCMGVAQISDTIYAATDNGILRIRDNSNLELLDNNPISPDKRITFIKSDSLNNLWFQPQGEGLYCYTPYNGFRNTSTINTIISNKIVRDLIIYEDKYFIAIDGLGVLCSDFGLKYPQLNTDKGSTHDESVYNLFCDTNGYLWLSTFTGGINYINPHSSGFLHLNPGGGN